MTEKASTGSALLGQYLKGRYHLTGILAEGPRSVVFRAKQLDLERDVAVKLLALRSSDYVELGQRLARSVKRAARVRHAGVAEVYEHGVTDAGFNFVAMELLGGTSLRRLLAREGKLPPAQAVEIGASIASALSALHAEGIVHANLTPAGVFLVPNHGGGRDVKLIGAGMALPLSFADIERNPDARRTLMGLGGERARKRPEVIYGSPDALCPELAYGAEPDARSDVYALGVLMYWMLSGVSPFSGASWEELVAQHIAQKPAPLGTRVEGVPPRLARAVMRALEKDPAARFESAAAFSNELWCALLPDEEPAAPPRQGRRLWLFAALASLLALVAVGAWLARHRPGATLTPVARVEPAPPPAPDAVEPAHGAPTPSSVAVSVPAPEIAPAPKPIAAPKKRGAAAPSAPPAPPPEAEPSPSYSLGDDLKEYR